MSYAVGNVIYGFPCSNEMLDAIASAMGKNRSSFSVEDWEKIGFEFPYESIADAIFGINLFHIDETEDIDIAEFNDKIQSMTASMKHKYADKISELPHEVQAIMQQPKLWICWSSS